MTKLYKLWITIKYQYYKLYWKVRPPKPSLSGFFRWHEINYGAVNQNAVGIGVIDDNM